MVELRLRVPEEVAQELKMLAEKLVSVMEGRDEDLTEDEYDRSFREAILELKEDGVIKKPRDYAWIMAAVNEGVVAGAVPFVSPQDFIDYMGGLGIDNVPCRSTLSSAYSSIVGRYPYWSYGEAAVAPAEVNHRKDVVARFKSAFARAKRRQMDRQLDN